MKKLIVVVIFSLMIQGLIAETSTPILFTSRGINENFGLYNVATDTFKPENNLVISLADQVASSKSWIDAKHNDESFYIIGHSMGGLRASGIAKAYGARTKGVITIGTPLKGFTPLMAPGMNKMKYDLVSISKTVAVGLAEATSYRFINKPLMSISPENPIEFMILSILNIVVNISPSSISETSFVENVVSAFNPEVRPEIAYNFLKMANFDNPLIKSIFEGSELPTIKEMTPYSEYLKTNVSEITSVVPGHYSQVPVGTRQETRWQPTGQFSGFFVTETVPVYETKWVDEAVTASKAIDDNTYVYNIRGTENDIRMLITDPEMRLSTDNTRIEFIGYTAEASDYYQSCKNWSFTTTAALAVAAVFVPPLWQAVAVGVATTANFANKENNCRQALYYMYDPNRIMLVINGGILEHDGFIPVSDQYDLHMGGRAAPFPETSSRLHGGRVFDIKASHFAQTADSRIWGTDGNLGSYTTPGVVGMNGEVMRFLEATEGSKGRDALYAPGTETILSERSF